MSTDRRLLLLHAHPDDETINNGATMARYADDGVGVTLVTCTLGEEGEVLVPELAGLAAGAGDQLGGYRCWELAQAMAALGVHDHRILGGPGRYRDSGMMGTPANEHPRCFWQADLDAAAAEAVAVLREVRPQVLVTYDPVGGYGHPDHIQAHRVAMRAVELGADPAFRPDLGDAWSVTTVYWTAMPESVVRDGVRRLREAGDTTTFEGMDPDGPMPPFVVPDDRVAAAIDGTRFVDRKLAAMRAHATQIAVDGPFFALSNNLGQQVWGTEYYQRADGGRADGGHRWVDDLFAGVEVG
ncbi:MAG: N-acetyl-1-D-myo-inositol-2-amino-2-deoxy-alpha-D-glucopyranoside deacetylase [Actinomycetes bacterium]